MHYYHKNNILSPEQFRLREGRSTVHQQLQIVNLVNDGFNKKLL